MTIDKNWPQLSSARIDDMVNNAIAAPQEKPAMVIWWSRPAMALAASVVLLVAVTIGWQTPRYSAPQTETVAATDGGDLSDYMIYELLEDLT